MKARMMMWAVGLASGAALLQVGGCGWANLWRFVGDVIGTSIVLTGID